MPADAGRGSGDLDLSGAAVLFVGLLCLVGPVLAARERHHAGWLCGIGAFGAATLAAFPRLERRIQQAGRTPLIDLDLLDDKRFVLGLAATACFFIANISVYLVVTLSCGTASDGPRWMPAAPLSPSRWRSWRRRAMALGEPRPSACAH